ncbi:uncharacterized protein [Nicotiana tomentosiformis]|uniref:uncharacterized protein n=1 Tax=Nicotiana tomentosiformis TaxID=4098 RepID=UPI00388C7348
MLRKDAATSWTEECQRAFDKIKEYLSKPPVLVPQKSGRPLLLYLPVLDGDFGCILGQHDETGRKEGAGDILSEQANSRLMKLGSKGMGYKEHQNIAIFALCTRADQETAYCAHVKEDIDENPWFHDNKKYLEREEYSESATHTQKRTLRRFANHFFQSGGILYRRTPDLGLLRCVDAKEASRLLEEIYARTCGPYMNGFILAKKILRAGLKPSYKVVTKKVVVDFIQDRIVCRFGVPESIIIDNAANLNSDLMKAMCQTFKIKHRNSTAYRQQMNGAVEAVNKNIKKILRKKPDILPDFASTTVKPMSFEH